jgi:hypothetical protein
MNDAQRYRRNAAQCLTAAEQRDSPYRRLALTIAALNGLWPPDHNATPWVAAPDGSWTRLVGVGVNPDMAPSKEGRVGTPPRIGRPPLRSESAHRP